MQNLPTDGSAVIVGATGGVGAALADALDPDPGFRHVVRLSRGLPLLRDAGKRGWSGPIDITDEASIAAAAAALPRPLRLVIVATGLLHATDMRPERSYRELDAAALQRSFAVNAIGPALIAKHMLPLMASSGRALFAVLSARVGSIGDNRSGGWHGYRASKAALNMILRNLAIELSRSRPESLCIGLHPGTVDTALSRPFQRSIPANKLFPAAAAAAHLIQVLIDVGSKNSGSVLDWAGLRLPP